MCVQNNRQDAFCFIKLLSVIRKMRVQNKHGLLFGLFSYFCNSETCVFERRGAAFATQKNVCSKKTGGCFLVY